MMSRLKQPKKLKNNTPDKTNIRLPGYNDSDDECHFCGDDTVSIVIRGNKAADCNDCGNEIAMCQYCFSVLMSKGDKFINTGKID